MALGSCGPVAPLAGGAYLRLGSRPSLRGHLTPTLDQHVVVRIRVLIEQARPIAERQTSRVAAVNPGEYSRVTP